jgi:hypothetical protein
MQRKSVDVINELLREMFCVVRSYHPDVHRTGRNIDELIGGTSFFLGGTGIWRGEGYRGSLPEFFPEHPIMFVAHNFDSVAAHDRAKANGGEYDLSPFWRVFREYLECAAIRRDDCFFTNALMGLQPGSSVGPMPTVPSYEDECRRFLRRQIEVVEPRGVVALGRNASHPVRVAAPSVPWIDLTHPSAWEFRARQTRDARIRVQAGKLAGFVGSLRR